MSEKRTCPQCHNTFDGYGLHLWCSVGCESDASEIASLQSRLQAMTERAEMAEVEVRKLREGLGKLVWRCEKDGICTPPCVCPFCRDFRKARAALEETRP